MHRLQELVREQVVNAIVHRPHRQRDGMFLNLHPDHLEVVNVGRLPLGVTPKNVLHASRRRNEGLARIFHDVKLMEREGSGFDLMYETLVASGRPPPSVKEGPDSVHVTVPRRSVKANVVKLVHDADQQFQLKQRERIALGLLAQSEGMTAAELCAALELEDAAALHSWTDRLLDAGLVAASGRTRARKYFVPPALLRAAGLDDRTTLASVDPHRLRALIREDLERHPDSSASEINRRIGREVAARTLRRALQLLIDAGEVTASGKTRWRRYRAIGHAQEGGR